MSKINFPCKSIQSIYMIALIVAILLSACGVAPAPIDGDVVNVLTGSTQWIINQASKNVPLVGTEVLWNAAKQLVVIGTPFQEGYGFVVMDAKTMTALENPVIAKNLTGNYVNFKTWSEFRDALLNNGWVTQILVTAASMTNVTWFTFVVGCVYMPETIEVNGIEVPNLPGLPDGYLEYLQ